MTVAAIDDKVIDELEQTTGAEFVRELVQVFFEAAPVMLAELRNAQAERAAERFRRAAHSLKTNALTFGANKLAELARALELGGIPDATSDLDALDAAYAAAIAAIKSRAHV